MKRLFTVVILFIYFTVSTGFVVSMHYCMNEFDSARIGIKGDSNCDRCGMETDGNCCWDDVKVVKLQFQHTIASLLNADFSTPLAAPAYTDFTLGAIHQIISPTSKIAHSPPLIHGAIYIKNCVFRI